MTNTSSVVPVADKVESANEAAKDPLRLMVEIAENKNLSDDDKSALILYAQSRFKNRRKMAYLSLLALITSIALLFIAAFIDGIRCPVNQVCEGGILTAIEGSENLIAWIGGFLTSIVGAYYGVSAWRPSS